MALDLSKKITSLEEKYILPCNTLYSPGQFYYWPNTFDEAHLLLQDFIDSDDLIKQPRMVGKNWNLETCMHSALFFYLKDNFEICKRGKSSLLYIYDWNLISKLILNAKISKQTLIFVRNLGLLKISKKDVIIKGCIKALRWPFVFYFEKEKDKDKDKKGLENLLYFLSVDEKKIDSLVDQAFETKSLEAIVDYLLTAKLEINEKFIFNEVLKDYRSLKEDKIMFAQIHQNIDSLLTFQFEELERFQVFDILESAEEAKIKISNLSFSSFYSNMIEDILNSKDERFYNTFVLFENFLFFDESQVFSFCDLSTKEIKNLIFDFSNKNEEQLLSEYNEKIPILDPNISGTKTESDFLEDKTIYSLIYSLLAFFIIVFGFFQIAAHNRRAAADLRTTNYSQPSVASISMSWLN